MSSIIKPIIIGLSGASGSIFGIRLIELLKEYTSIPVYAIMSQAAIRTMTYETSYKVDYLKEIADRFYPIKDIGADIASGSNITRGMIVAPCSIKTMSEIAHGITGNLLSRSADVCLKEKRKLILAVREMPFHTGHLRSMTQLSEMGAIVAPPVPAFYHTLHSLEEMIDQICMRWLSLFDIDIPLKKTWNPSKDHS